MTEALIALAVMLLVNTISVAFFYGKIWQKVTDLHSSNLIASTARIETLLNNHLEHETTEMKQAIVEMAAETHNLSLDMVEIKTKLGIERE